MPEFVIEDLANYVIASATIIYTLGTFLLWRVTTRSARSIEDQLHRQNDYYESSSGHSTIDAHREIFLAIIGDADLAEIVFADDPKDISESLSIKRDIITSILINHCLRIYVDYQNGIQNNDNLEQFIADAQSMFSIPVVIQRWNHVKGSHRRDFREFIDTKVIAQMS